MNAERCVFSDPAHEAARYVARLLRQSGTDRPVTLALSGGSTPVPLYHALAAEEGVPWSRLHVFLVDERFVPLDAEESNWKLARETLLSHVPVPECNLYPVPTHLNTATEAAAAYEATLRAALGPTPAWDVAVMGMGEDGHTASLFPGSDFQNAAGLIAATISPPTSPVKHRITATLPFLNRTRHVVYLVTGAQKRDLVARVFGDAGACPDVPAACVRGTQSTRWYLDEAAAGPA